MGTHSHHHDYNFNERYEFAGKAKMFSIVAVVLGVAAVAFGLLSGDHVTVERTYANLLLMGYYFTCVCAAGAFFVALKYVTQASWSAGLLRIPQAMGSILPIAALILLVIIGLGLSTHNLYHHWHAEGITDPHSANYDPIIAGKSAYLNLPFFLTRQIVFMGIYSIFAVIFAKLSYKEDLEGGLTSYKKAFKLSAIFLVIFGFTTPIWSFDTIMSLEAHWFSTMFGWYNFAAMWVSGIAAITVILIVLKKAGYMNWVNENHLHDLGKLMFGFSIFWTYVWFAQFMLIWYSNIPEETVYFYKRWEPEYKPWFWLSIIINFVAPLLLLVDRDAKRKQNVMLFVAILLLAGHWLDYYIMIMPGTVAEHRGFGIIEIGTALGFIGLFTFLVLNKLSKQGLVAKIILSWMKVCITRYSFTFKGRLRKNVIKEMSFKLNNRFKSISGFVLALGLLFATPILASQQDTVASDSAKAATTAVAAPAATDSVAKDTTAAAGTAAVASTSSSTEASAAAPAVEEVKQIDPQVYKNFTYYVLLFLVVCTIIAVVGKVLSIYELTRKMNGKYNPFANNTFQGALFLLFLVGFIFGVYWSYEHWGFAYWRSAVTEHGVHIDNMFIVTTAITTFVMIITHILLLSFPYIYRMRRGHKALYYPHNNTIEKIWTIVPAIVLTILVLFGFFTWRKITNVPEDLQKSALQIEVMGEQFQWNVRYTGADGTFGKRNYKLTTPSNPYGIDFNDKNSWDDIQGADIVLPVNKSVRFHIISKDIIHSFFIPDFRVQINAVPGMTNYFQFTPTVTTEEMRDRLGDYNYDFIMLCNKICGQGHFNMAKKVVVVTEAQYKEWLAKQNKYFTEDLQKEFSGKTANVKKDSVQVTASLN